MNPLGYLEESVDTIDAGIFVGDSFHNWEAIAELEYYMARWHRALNQTKELMREDPEFFGEEPK